MEPYTHARLEGGLRRSLLYAELRSALYSARVDLQDQRAAPLGIRQGRRVLFRHSQLVALHADYRAQLAAGDHWGVVQARESSLDHRPAHNQRGGFCAEPLIEPCSAWLPPARPPAQHADEANRC